MCRNNEVPRDDTRSPPSGPQKQRYTNMTPPICPAPAFTPLLPIRPDLRRIREKLRHFLSKHGPSSGNLPLFLTASCLQTWKRFGVGHLESVGVTSLRIPLHQGDTLSSTRVFGTGGFLPHEATRRISFLFSGWRVEDKCVIFLVRERGGSPSSKRRRTESKSAEYEEVVDKIYADSSRLRQCSKYFETCMKTRWAPSKPLSSQMEFHLELQAHAVYYRECFSRMKPLDFLKPIRSVEHCLELLKIAQQIMYQDLVDLGIKLLISCTLDFGRRKADTFFLYARAFFFLMVQFTWIWLHGCACH
ncbi:hypothetical protein KC19_N033100 [Ceratodon purpureus]|nr:hypothetical protein KC19_N033100 [Ceratodon purpureus]